MMAETTGASATATGPGAATDTQPTSQPPPARLSYLPTQQPRPLKEEVLELIAPWRDSLEPPPFTAGELVVIMLVLLDSEIQPHSPETIERDLLSTFKYYEDFHDLEWIDPVVPGLYQAVEDFEHPACIATSETPSSATEIGICDATLVVPNAAARLYLRDKLESPRKGTFEFMELPAEIREKIFKMLLVYPKSGLALAINRRSRDDDGIRLRGKGFTDVEAPAHPADTDVLETDIPVGKLSDILTILRVSKQIRHEALPVFYGRNTFQFGTLKLLFGALRLMSRETLQQIQTLRIVMDPLSLKQLELIAPRNTEFWRFCGGGIAYESGSETPDPPLRIFKLGNIQELDGIIFLAQRTENLKTVGDGFLVPWLREKIGTGEEKGNKKAHGLP
ncbi:hypothetical protein CBER1_10395 [Cercospora berteroae]|uniref:DUF7730 domain-containing protein n=1 Tax=Cercospora berteroae TaxID=357750 RepID=A0A2S6BX28_9PEZI|nr:hypothetical protein CBER1_10395 [Cercospora berteroae]